MTKAPAPGRVKTRLQTRYTPHQAAQIHRAMLQCTLERLAKFLPGNNPLKKIVAIDRPPSNPPSDTDLPPAAQGWKIIDQGTGDLGERMLRVAASMNTTPMIFFGADSPDLPAKVIAEIPTKLRDRPAAVGPTHDGGYWCIAMRDLTPTLLRGIDWGSHYVYDQTVQAAHRHGIPLATLPAWHDVDRPEDVDALRHRLRDAKEAPLNDLRKRLDRIGPPDRSDRPTNQSQHGELGSSADTP